MDRTATLVLASLLAVLAAAPAVGSSHPDLTPILPAEVLVLRSDLIAVVEIIGKGEGLSIWNHGSYFVVENSQTRIIEVLGERPAGDTKAAVAHAVGPAATQSDRSINILRAVSDHIDTAPEEAWERVSTQPADSPILAYRDKLPLTGRSWGLPGPKCIVFLKRLPAKDTYGVYGALLHDKAEEARLRRLIDVDKWPWGKAENGLQLAAMPCGPIKRPFRDDGRPIQNWVIGLRNTGQTPFAIAHDVYSVRGIQVEAVNPAGQPQKLDFSSLTLPTGDYETSADCLVGFSPVIQPGGVIAMVARLSDPGLPSGDLVAPGWGRWKITVSYACNRDKKIDAVPLWKGHAEAATVEYPERATGPAAQPATRSDKEEADRRAALAMKWPKLGLRPDMRSIVFDLVDDYVHDTTPGRSWKVNWLLGAGADGRQVAMQIIRTEDRPSFREDLLRDFGQGAGVSYDALDRHRLDYAAARLEACARCGNSAARRDLVAFLLITGGLDSAIRRIEAEPPDKASALMLVALYRAKGDWKKTASLLGDACDFDTAVAAERWDLALAVLDRMDKALGQETGETLGQRAALNRLAGDKAKSDQAIKNLLDDHWREEGKLLVLNERIEDGLRIFREEESPFYLDMLVALMRYDQALRWRPKKPSFWDDYRRAELLDRLGETDKVKAMIPGLLAAARADHDWMGILSVAKLQYDLGLADDAFATAATAQTADVHFAHQLSHIMFPEREDLGQTWWELLRRQHPNDNLAATMGRWRREMETPMTPQRFAALAEQAERFATTQGEKAKVEHVNLLRRLEGAAEEVGDRERAQAIARKDRTLHYGPDKAESMEALVRQKRWLDVLARCQKEDASDSRGRATDYFEAYALVQLGREDGPWKLKLANLAPLSDGHRRVELAKELASAGLARQSDEQWLIAQRTSDPWDLVYSRIEDWEVHRAVADGDYDRLARLWEGFLLAGLHDNAWYRKGDMMLFQIAQLHGMRALADAAAKRFDDAAGELARVREFNPTGVDIQIDVINEMTNRGGRAQADAAFNASFDLFAAARKQYPNSTYLANLSAWLAARTGRRLDEAQVLAERAVKVKPTEAAYVDTLAEVHFQLGHPRKACELEERAISLQPKAEAFRQQLRRFKSSPAASAPSGEPDDK